MYEEVRESVVLQNFGQKIFGIYHRPVGLKKYPALLMCHGLGGHKSGKYRLYVNLSRMLSREGIASLRIDFRGSGDSEGEFSDMTLESEVSDALKGLEFLANDAHVDTNRLGIFGRSFGGTVALLAATRFGKAKTLATWAPVFSGNQWLEKWQQLHSNSELTDESRKNMMRINGQVPGYDFFKQLFNIKMEEELKGLSHAPLLHIHGEQDKIVDIYHAHDYQRLRKQAIAETKFIRLPHSDHDFSHPEEQELALQETCKWFTKTLD